MSECVRVYQEEVVCVWTFTANFVQLHQVIELTVDVTTDGDWCIHSLYIALIHQDLTRLGTQRLHLRLLQVLTTLHKRGSGGEGGMARVVCVSCVHHAMAQHTHKLGVYLELFNLPIKVRVASSTRPTTCDC